MAQIKKPLKSSTDMEVGMRKEDRKEYEELEYSRRCAQEMLDEGFLTSLNRWFLKHIEQAQKHIVDQIRKRR